MYRKHNQQENCYTFLARKFYEERNSENIDAGKRLVYRIIKIYDGKSNSETIARDVAKIVPMWMLAQKKVDVERCITSLVCDNHIINHGNFYCILAQRQKEAIFEKE